MTRPMTTPPSPSHDIDTPDLNSLESLAHQALANGWPAETVLTVTENIIGPVPAPTEPLDRNVHVGGASHTLHQIFAEAAQRLHKR